jgi:hypothetical protein
LGRNFRRHHTGARWQEEPRPLPGPAVGPYPIAITLLTKRLATIQNGYELERSLTKPIKVAPKPTSKLIVTATAIYGATLVLTKGLSFLGMQPQSTAMANANNKIPVTNIVIVSPCNPRYGRYVLFK